MSTAKSMANNYLNGKRAANGSAHKLTLTAASQHRFKSSTGSLAATNQSAARQPTAVRNSPSTLNRSASSPRLIKSSSSMSNLQSANEFLSTAATKPTPSRLQRPQSRNALDNIHNGMNAKYAQVQSKVYLQNIRPTSRAQNPTAARGPEVRRTGRTGASRPANERSAALSKVKGLQDELDQLELERDQLRQELEREKADKGEQLNLVKLELQEKVAEHEKQNEQYHQKLLDAYELADQNRRAADSVLAESRQRDDDNRKRIEELETQLTELREFVAQKEELTSKMLELREQIRTERDRYEEQLKSLHQVFEKEKISQSNRELCAAGSELALDRNSNYFSRLKPSLESTESINKLRSGRSRCPKCSSGSSQLHCSQSDMYGSRLSTRMQAGARSAWRASKQLASSVVTGRMSIVGCRKQKQKANPRVEVAAPEVMASSAEEHTSVVEVTSGDQEQVRPVPEPNDLVVRCQVDANNKLTILTKFNEPAAEQPAASSTSSSECESERSRCESSSSGRGTGSETGSTAASQNGDHVETSSEEPQVAVHTSIPAPRKSKGRKLLKATKSLGSQLSLNKLRGLLHVDRKSSTEARANQEVELELDRARCLELNAAIKQADQPQVA